MGNHYSAMVFSMSLWGNILNVVFAPWWIIVLLSGGPDVDMGWMDGVTGCGGVCTIDSATVTFKNFKVGDYKDRIYAGLARTAANETLGY